VGSDRTFGQLVADYLISAVEADGTFVRITGPETEDRYAAAIGRQVARTLVPSGPPRGGLEEAAPGSGTRGVNLAGVPRAADIEREVCRLGLPIRTAPVDVVRPG
jgi:hypothetical protein